MTNSNYSKLVERYLEGEMTPKEASEFESMLHKDPLLADEHNLQQEIINGVKNFRKSELKMRLDNVDVTPGIFQTIAGSTSTQVASVVALTSAVFVGSYLWVDSSEITKEESIDLLLSPKTIELQGDGYVDNTQLEIPTLNLPSYEDQLISEVEPVIVTEKSDPIKIQREVATPELADSGDSEDILPEVGEQITLDNRIEKNAAEIEIENLQVSKKKLEYKFYNNKLYLYGDFSGIPYEVLEINSLNGKQLFLFHNGSFYRISENVTKSQALRKVENDNLIKELNILRDNKSE